MRQVFFRAKEAQSRPVESWEGGEYRDVASPRQRPQGLSGLERWGPTHTGTHGHGGRSRAFRPASARGLTYYPGVFNYLFLMDLQGLFHQARGGWVWGCRERAARAGAGKMAHISILKPFTIVSSMKDAANKTEPPAPASPSRKF